MRTLVSGGSRFEPILGFSRMDDWKAVGEVFADIRPATCLVEVSRFIDPDWLVEIEVDANVEGKPHEH
jgi:enamine deaminase RidA (YjgF/YER057c/UK114 family)